MMVTDADGDGAQEIIYGSSTIASNGTRLCSTGFGHGDTLHVGVLTPSLQINDIGTEVFMVHGPAPAAYDVHDAFTCTLIAKGPRTGIDNRAGVADDVWPGNAGAEMWSDASSALLSATDGHSLGTKPTSTNFLIYWDADESRELEDGTQITKYGAGTLLSCTQCAADNFNRTPHPDRGPAGRLARGDRLARGGQLGLALVHNHGCDHASNLRSDARSPVPHAVSAEQTGFNQPPHAGFHIGNGMTMPPKPDIFVRAFARLSVFLQGRKPARPEGIEPPALGLEGRCSIHLSYGRPVEKYHAVSVAARR